LSLALRKEVHLALRERVPPTSFLQTRATREKTALPQFMYSTPPTYNKEGFKKLLEREYLALQNMEYGSNVPTECLLIYQASKNSLVTESVKWYSKVLRIRIRDPVPFGRLDPGSGIGKKIKIRNRDPG
jgi:hypothetical protein